MAGSFVLFPPPLSFLSRSSSAHIGPPVCARLPARRLVEDAAKSVGPALADPLVALGESLVAHARSGAVAAYGALFVGEDAEARGNPSSARVTPRVESSAHGLLMTLLGR